MPHSRVAAPAARKFRRTAAASLPVALAVAALAGCGQKGALVLPTAPSSVPVPVPEATRPVEQPAPPPAEPAGGASAPVR